MMPRILLLSFAILTAISCNDDIEGLFPDPLDPFQKTFTSSLFVEVIDTSGLPVRNAMVQIGNVIDQTDSEGYLILNSITLGKSSYLTVHKDGYFHASRRFYPSPGKSQYLKIILLPNSRIAFFSSSVGATIAVKGGMTLYFPKDAYEYKNGESYQGEVFVSACPIVADDPDLSFKMPGDLVGVNTNEQMGALASLGMLAVEIKASDGHVLQIKKGNEVGLRMEIPVSMLNDAPSSIPMWFFDEENGIWKEEGKATRIDNAYVGQAAHFSYWNYDAWFEIVKWGATILHEDGTPANQILVCITIPALNTSKCDYTNEEGIVCGMVAANEILEMKVVSPCGDIPYTQQIGPFADSIMLPPIFISSPDEFTLSGIAVNCQNLPVVNGYAIISQNDIQYYKSLDPETGSFSSTFINCAQDDLTITIIDSKENKHSFTKIYSYASSINAGAIEVCQDLNEYLILEIEGIPGEISFDSLNFRITKDDYFLLDSYHVDSLNTKYVHFSFIGSSKGNYPGSWAEIGITLESGERIFTNEVDVQITYFGEIGDYVQGFLSGILSREMSQTISYPFTGRFSVLRK